MGGIIEKYNNGAESICNEYYYLSSDERKRQYIQYSERELRLYLSCLEEIEREGKDSIFGTDKEKLEGLFNKHIEYQQKLFGYYKNAGCIVF